MNLFQTQSSWLFPKDLMSFTEVTVHWGKTNTLQGLLNTNGYELPRIPGNPEHYNGHSVEFYLQGQVINGVGLQCISQWVLTFTKPFYHYFYYSRVYIGIVY